jgi:hypothetical protein
MFDRLAALAHGLWVFVETPLYGLHYMLMLRRRAQSARHEQLA